MKEIGWVVQENLSSDRHVYTELKRIFEAHDIPHEFVTYIPFDDKLPDFNRERLNIFYGAVRFIENVYNSHDFRSCVFFNPKKFRMDNYIDQWKERMLSSDAIITTLGKIPELKDKFNNDTDLFIRPVEDSKVFDGKVLTFDKILDWKNTITAINGTNLDEDIEILISEPYKINKEWRNIIINGKVVSSSRYMKNQRLNKDGEDIPEDMIKFCETSCQIYTPDDVFVMDIGETGGDYYIIECGCVNSVGFYESDVEKIVLEITNYVKTFMWKFEGL